MRGSALVGVIAAVAMAACAPAAGAAPGWRSPFDLSGRAPVAQAPTQPPTWSDEFDGSTLDLTRWSHRATGPRHDCTLTPEAVSVGGGMLTIKTFTENGRHYSGMISTYKNGSAGFEQQYGYFEARVRFNTSPGQWSAFWLQSPTIGNPVGDPATAGVEMDIAEHRARCVTAPPPTPAVTCATDISNRVQQALIWDGYGTDSKATLKLGDPLPALGNGSWHTWALRWTPTYVTFYYDDSAIWSVLGPISRRSQYIILSSEVGESFAGAIPAVGYGSRATSTTNMQVDYVRVWESAPVNTAAPEVSGTPAVGQGLASSPGSWFGDPRTFTYQWLRDGSSIGGASTPTYTVQSADQGHVLSCIVTATNSAGSTGAPSNLVAIPAPQPAPPPVPPPPPPLKGSSEPNARLSGSTSQRVGATVIVTVTCPDEACRATATGNVRVPRLGRARARTYKLKAPTTTIAKGRQATIKLKLSAGARAAITRALRARRRIVVKLDVRVLNGTGDVRTLHRRIALELRKTPYAARR